MRQGRIRGFTRIFAVWDWWDVLGLMLAGLGFWRGFLCVLPVQSLYFRCFIVESLAQVYARDYAWKLTLLPGGRRAGDEGGQTFAPLYPISSFIQDSIQIPCVREMGTRINCSASRLLRMQRVAWTDATDFQKVNR